MNVVTLDSARIIARLNSLPKHSRLRAGYVDVLRQIRKEELAHDHMTAMFDEAVRLAFPDDFARIEETY